MKSIAKLALGAAMVAGIVSAATSPADARVVAGVGIGAPDYYYGPGHYPSCPCYSYGYYYTGYCGYPSYSRAVFIDGQWIYGPHYYRWWGGRLWFWYRGGWHNWNGRRGARWHWNRGGSWHGRWHSGGWHGAGGHGGGHRY